MKSARSPQSSPPGHGKQPRPAGPDFFCLWSNMWSTQMCQKSNRRKSSKIKVKRTKTIGFSPFCGGDYRTRICDLLRVKIRPNKNGVLFAPFDSESSNKMSGQRLSSPMAPPAHFGVWVSVWVKARCTGLRHSIRNGL